MAELYELGVAELLDAFRSGTASPVDALDSCLARIAEVEPAVNAVLTLSQDSARRRARRSELRWLAGSARPLEGIPVGLKDIINTAGVRTTGGSAIFGEYVPAESATVAARLERAGAVCVAKLQTMEFAMGSNCHYGPTLNPWDPGRVTGGSSCGSAVALAALELPLTVGTDTGNSIRSPASFCGVSGLKPTFGSVSRHGVMPLSWTLDHVGPMARSADDLAIAFPAMAGHDSRDPYSWRSRRIARPCPDIGDLRVAIPADWFFDLLAPDVEQAYRATAAALQEAGATLVEVPLPHAHLADPASWVIILAEMASLHASLLPRLDEYGAGMTRQLMVTAQFVQLPDYLRALRIIPVLQADFEQAFAAADVLLAPGMPTTAPEVAATGFRIGGADYPWEELVSRTMSIFNLTGLPSLAVPAGFGTDGMPLAVQIVAPPGRDDLSLHVGSLLQTLTCHHRQRPPLGARPADQPAKEIP
jgi:aspartyl-tRNA(Asn)/glutamyl-tRNA(Gln) amidotransferase subunit A